jgi:hypothetical protein|tara:strand:+ start:5184 stop:6095 length:912 start_codon:yes stop_codon:yes gene_type:complete
MREKTDITYSAFSTFRNCRQKYKHRYVDQLVKVQSPVYALWYGRLIHECLEKWYRGKSMGEILTYIEDEKLDGSDLWLHAVATMVSYEKLYPKEPFRVIDIEEEFCVPIINPKTGKASTDMQLRGKIDGLIKLEDGALAIFEHKTTSERTKDYVRGLWSDFQTRLYCDAYGRYIGKPIRRALFNVVRKSACRRRKGESDDSLLERLIADAQFHREELVFDPMLLSEIGEQVWELKDNVQAARRVGVWYKNESSCKKWGRMCDYYDLCSSGNNPIVKSSLYEVKRRHEELSPGGTHATSEPHPA